MIDEKEEENLSSKCKYIRKELHKWKVGEPPLVTVIGGVAFVYIFIGNSF